MIKDATPSRLAIAAAFAAIAIPTTPVLAQEVAAPPPVVATVPSAPTVVAPAATPAPAPAAQTPQMVIKPQAEVVQQVPQAPAVTATVDEPAAAPAQPAARPAARTVSAPRAERAANSAAPAAVAAPAAATAAPTAPVETVAPMTPAPTAAPEPTTAPAASETVSPLQSNGDGSLLGLWIALAAGAVVAAGGLLLWRRNRRDVEAIQPVAPPATAMAQPAYAAEPVRATEMAAPGLTPREAVAEPVVARPSYVEPREPVMAQRQASRAVARTSAAHPVVTRGMHATMAREQAAHPVADRIHPAEREKMRVAREAALPFGKGRRVDDSRRSSDYPTGNFVPA